MKTLVVACIQQKMRLPQTLEEYQEELRRFLRAAANKRARLVIFPELAGVMVMPPLLKDFHAKLLQRADLGRRRQSSLWQKLGGGVSGALAGWLNADFRRMAGALLTTQPQMVSEAYNDVFGGLAREFDMTLVGPSAYLPDPLDGVIRNISVVYGPDGEQLGYQAKRVLHEEDEDLCQPGYEWNVIPTPAGRIGLMLGGDLLYPEVGRVLAYQGAEMLIAQGAATERVLFEKLRSGMLARMQDNQLFAAVSFLVGRDEFSRRKRTSFVGRSSVLAPQELTPRSSGILVESSNVRSESVLSAEWDFSALANLWETSDTPVRSRLPLETVGPALAALYQKMKQLPEKPPAMPPPAERNDKTEEPHTRKEVVETLPKSAMPALSLDDLPVLATVNSYWKDPNTPGEEPIPGATVFGGYDDAQDEEERALVDPPELQQDEDEGDGGESGEGDSKQLEGGDPPAAAAGPQGESPGQDAKTEEETEEMDALLEPGADDKSQNADPGGRARTG